MKDYCDRNRAHETYIWFRDISKGRAGEQNPTMLDSRLTFTGARIAGEGVAHGAGAGKTARSIVTVVATGGQSRALIIICKDVIILIINFSSIMNRKTEDEAQGRLPGAL